MVDLKEIELFENDITTKNRDQYKNNIIIQQQQRYIRELVEENEN